MPSPKAPPPAEHPGDAIASSLSSSPEASGANGAPEAQVPPAPVQAYPPVAQPQAPAQAYPPVAQPQAPAQAYPPVAQPQAPAQAYPPVAQPQAPQVLQTYPAHPATPVRPGTPTQQPTVPLATQYTPGVATYTRLGILTADQLINGKPDMFAPVEARMLEVLDKVRNELVTRGLTEQLVEARHNPVLRFQLAEEIDRRALAFLMATGRQGKGENPLIVALIVNEILGLGPLEPLWDYPSITEVIVNGPTDIYVERAGTLTRVKGAQFRSPEHLLEICQQILAPLNRKLDIKDPLADGRLPDGSRVNAVHYAIAPKGPLLTIRRFPETNRSLIDLVDLGSMSPDMACTIAWLIRSRASLLVCGGTGTGKLLTLGTEIPTPSGRTTMGELKVGDEVIGRDGNPCRVTFLSEIEQTPDLYRITFSDGQEVIADADHQWVVSDFSDRRRPRRDGKRQASLDRYHRMTTSSDALKEMAAGSDDSLISATELWGRISHLDLPWKSRSTVWHALFQAGCPSEIRMVTQYRARKERVVPQAVKHYPVHAALDVLAENWRHSRRYANTLAELGETRFRTAGFVKNRVDGTETMSTSSMAIALDLAVARYEEEPSLQQDEQVLTTRKMIEAGVRTAAGQAMFAVRVAQALELPEADLPVDPYVLGAWLGDGSTGTGGITGIDMEILQEIEAAGYEVTHRNDPKSHYIRGLSAGLREAGCFDRKHVPLGYLRGSSDQRLALLQGLMDTDGTIGEAGSCEISLNSEELALGVLDLVRSLGIKASMTRGESAYMATDPATGEKYRKVTGTRHRIKFITTNPVFRLPRKLERIPETLRDTTNWLYITSIEPVHTEPGRCIQVDSPDSTYLCAGYVPTHNTTLLNAFSAAIERSERVVTIEDSLELRLHPESHVAAMEARPASASGSNAVAIRDLVKNALRMRPDRIIVGEVRGSEALNMLEACNTGHEGSMSTVHANGPNEALARLAVMVAQGGEMPADKVDWLVGSALDLIVQIRRYKDGSRRVSGIYEVPNLSDMPPGSGLKTIPLWEWKREGTDAKGRVTGSYVQVNEVSDRLREKLGLDFEPVVTFEELKVMVAQ